MEAIVSVIASIVVSLLAVAGFTSWVKLGMQNVQTALTASQLLIFDQAALKYTEDNAGPLLGGGLGVAQPIPPAQLTNYLPVGFAQTNAFNQAWQLQVMKTGASTLQALVTSTGGTPISDTKQLAQIAAQAGAQGGFIPYANQGADGAMQPTTARGAYGGWQVPMAGYANPGSGHLASLLAFNGSSGTNDYLYRVAMPAQPALNSMQTNLGMTDSGGTAHDITGANTVTAATFSVNGAGEMLADQGGSLELGGNSTTAGTGTPYIDFHQGGQGIQNFNTRIINDASNRLTIAGANGQGSLNVQGTLGVGSVATPGAVCQPSPSGALIAGASDGSGMILSCQFGQWQPIGGRWVAYGNYMVGNTASVVAAPNCPGGGTPEFVNALQDVYIDNSAGMNIVYTTVPGGWQVQLESRDGSALPNGVNATVTTYCAY